jgi:hypothetical protein
MQPLRAHVENGRIVVDDPTSLPDGTQLRLVEVPDVDDLNDDERVELHAAIREGLEDVEAGRTVDAAEVIAELRARA